MANKLIQLKEKIKNKIEQFDNFIKDYSSTTKNTHIPATAYMNWGIELAQNGDINSAIDKIKEA